jgi:hypothetical protein
MTSATTTFEAVTGVNGGAVSFERQLPGLFDLQDDGLGLRWLVAVAQPVAKFVQRGV